LFELYLVLLLLGVLFQLSTLVRNMILQHAYIPPDSCKSKFWDLLFLSGAIFVLVYSVYNSDAILFTGEFFLVLIHLKYRNQMQN